MADVEILRALNEGFNGVHSRLDNLNETQSKHTTKIALIEAKLPSQPCEILERHLKDHPDKRDTQELIINAQNVNRGIRKILFDSIKGAFKLGLAAIAGALGFKFLGDQ